jgi:hydrogenase maturation protease
MTGRARGVLVVGYGNTLRGDDGVGRVVAERLAADPRLRGADVRAVHQLTPELASDVSAANLLVLVDASTDTPEGSVLVQALPPVATAGSSSHHVGPSTLVALARELWGAAPPVYLVEVGVETMDVGDRLSPRVDDAVPVAMDAVVALVAEHGRA